MRYLFTLIGGLLVGAVIGCAGLYLNPLTEREAPEALDNDWTLTYGTPTTEGVAFTHGGASRLLIHPAGISELWENTVSQGLLSVVEMADDSGVAVGVASRISFPSESTELLGRGVIYTDQWVITIPGEGTFFVHCDSNMWPFIKENILPVWYLRRPWDGPHTYRPTVGPELRGLGQVTGATGRFVGLHGNAVERYRLSAFNDRVGPEQLRAELSLRLPDEARSAPFD